MFRIIREALRVSRAVTRLAVYRPLEVLKVPCLILKVLRLILKAFQRLRLILKMLRLILKVPRLILMVPHLILKDADHYSNWLLLLVDMEAAAQQVGAWQV